MLRTEVINLMPISNRKYGDSITAEAPVMIPPLTLKLVELPKSLTQEKLTSLQVTKATLPSSFDIRDKILPGQLTTVLDQGACGGCWAFAIAGAASDIFTKQQRAKGNKVIVQISPTSVMSSLPYDQITNVACYGGDPQNGVRLLSENQWPLSTNHCQNFTWYDTTCDNKDLSAAGGAPHPLNVIWKKYQGPVQNAGGGVGCYYTRTDGGKPIDHDQFRITQEGLKSPQSIPDQNVQNPTTRSTQQIQNAQLNQNAIKTNLIENGTVVGGFAVLTDFLGGGDTSKAVPKEIAATLSGPLKCTDATNTTECSQKWNSSWLQVNDTHGKVYVSSPDYCQLDAGHAVDLVGWGTSKDLAAKMEAKFKGASWFGNAKKENVDFGAYWIVRNSWTTKWGNEGYFNIAMYPVNTYSQFSYFFPPNITSLKGKTLFGGVWTAFKAGPLCGGGSTAACRHPLLELPKKKREKLIKAYENNCGTRKWPKKFFQKSMPGGSLQGLSGESPGEGSHGSKISTTSIIVLSVVGGIVLIAVLILIFK